MAAPKLTKTCTRCGEDFSPIDYRTRTCCFRATLEERFWRGVTKTETCWLWTGGTVGGYGIIKNTARKMRYTHRLSWEIHFGPIPEGMQVCHACDVRNCVNPSHLWLGDAAANTADRDAKGRGNPPRGGRNPFAKLTPAKVLAIRAISGRSQCDIAAEFGVQQPTVWAVIRRKTWTHV